MYLDDVKLACYSYLFINLFFKKNEAMRWAYKSQGAQRGPWIGTEP